MNKYVFLPFLVFLIAGPALAEPKTITVENCAKIEIEAARNVTATGDRFSQTVKCIGNTDGEPKVREPTTTIGNSIILTPGWSGNTTPYLKLN